MSLNDDVYPTFSICLVFFNGDFFQNGMEQERESYYRFIQGEKRNYSNGNNYSDFDFDKMVISLKDVVLANKRKSKGSDNKYITKSSLDFTDSFKVVYQEPRDICFTKREKEQEKELIKYDLVRMNLTRLYSITKFDIAAYIHTKGQFIRKFPKETHRIRWKTIQKLKGIGFNYIVRLHNNAIEVLRRRPDAHEKCDGTLQDEDQQWRLSVIKEVGCIPAFEKRFLVGSSEGGYLLETLPKCDNDGYYRHRHSFSPYDNLDAGKDLYTGPCTEKSSIVTNTEEIVYEDKSNLSTLVFKFNYEEGYKEIINRKAFSLADLWSQVGGFVGIFIGYSLIQIPATITVFYKRIKKSFHNKKKGRL